MSKKLNLTLLAGLLAGSSMLMATEPGPGATPSGVAVDTPKFTHGWPAYNGPDGTYADQSKVPLLDDLSRAKLRWISEHEDLGYGKTSSKGGHRYGPGHPNGSCDLIVAGGLVIAGYFNPKNNVVADDIILAVDAATGKTKWKQVLVGKGVNCLSVKRPTYGATPATAQGKVFHIGTTGRIYCVDLTDGKPLWESFIGAEAPKLIDEQAAKALVEKPSNGYGITFLQYLQVCAQVLLVPVGDTLVGFDIATGKRLWECAGVLSGGNVPSPVTIENQWTLFCVNGKGEMRLMEAKTGKILWTKATSPSISHLTQAIAADGKAFMWNPGETVVENGKNRILGKPACYELKLDGAKLLWELPGNYQHQMGGDGGQCAKTQAGSTSRGLCGIAPHMTTRCSGMKATLCPPNSARPPACALTANSRSSWRCARVRLGLPLMAEKPGCWNSKSSVRLRLNGIGCNPGRKCAFMAKTLDNLPCY